MRTRCAVKHVSKGQRFSIQLKSEIQSAGFVFNFSKQLKNEMRLSIFVYYLDVKIPQENEEIRRL